MSKKLIFGIAAIIIAVSAVLTMLQSNSSRYDKYSSDSSYREEYRNNYDEDDEVGENNSSVDLDEPIRCPWCNGQGITPFGNYCSDCGGTGRMTRRQIGAGIEDYPNQRGRKNGSSTSSSSGEGCRQCRIPGRQNVKGNGQCSSCNGAGTFTGLDLDRIVCKQCAGKKPNGEGDGRCRYCNGTGWR